MNQKTASPAARHESGQVVVLIALALVVLMGFAGLAIDGGNLYTEQRRVQAAADNAVLAVAYKRMTGEAVFNNLRAAAWANANVNGYNNDGTTNTVTLNWPPAAGPYKGNPEYMEVVITQAVHTALVHFVYTQNPVPVTVRAVARARPGGAGMAGFAIATLKNCVAGGGAAMEITGGGNSGGILTYGGGIFINGPETAGNHCSIDPPNSANNYGIYADPAYGITSVGSYNYAGAQNMGPLPITTGANGGVPMTDPLAAVAEPECTSNGSVSGSVYQPGRYGGAGQPSIGNGATLRPGIYCITGDVGGGNFSATGTGVVIVMKTGGKWRTSGNGSITLSGPTTSNCLNSGSSQTSSCEYVGMVFWSRHCMEAIDGGGNAAVRLTGTVYVPCGTVNGHGGGNNPEEAFVYGQLIVGTALNNGNATTRVYYDEAVIFQMPPSVSLVE